MKLSCAVLLLLMSLAVGTAKATTFSITSTADSGPGTLRAALAGAANGDTIDTAGVSGTILLTSGELLVNKNVAIVGPGPGRLAVDGNAAKRVFHIGPNTVTTIGSLTITNGFVTGTVFPADRGGGIYNEHATLTITNCTVCGNVSSYFYGTPSSGQYSGLGGGIYNDHSALIVNHCTLSGNLAGPGVLGGGGN